MSNLNHVKVIELKHVLSMAGVLLKPNLIHRISSKRAIFCSSINFSWHFFYPSIITLSIYFSSRTGGQIIKIEIKEEPGLEGISHLSWIRYMK